MRNKQRQWQVELLGGGRAAPHQPRRHRLQDLERDPDCGEGRRRNRALRGSAHCCDSALFDMALHPWCSVPAGKTQFGGVQAGLASASYQPFLKVGTRRCTPNTTANAPARARSGLQFKRSFWG